MPLIVQQVAIEALTDLKWVIRDVRRRDRSLADQLRRASSSVVLNIAEGARSQGKNSIARFYTAMGSANEVRAGLQVAVAWDYISAAQVDPCECKLDRVCAMLWGLTHRGGGST